MYPERRNFYQEVAGIAGENLPDETLPAASAPAGEQSNKNKRRAPLRYREVTIPPIDELSIDEMKRAADLFISSTDRAINAFDEETEHQILSGSGRIENEAASTPDWQEKITNHGWSARTIARNIRRDLNDTTNERAYAYRLDKTKKGKEDYPALIVVRDVEGKDENSPKEVSIDWVTNRPGFRSGGEVLIEHVVSKAGPDPVISVFAGDEEAKRIYKSLGFTKDDRSNNENDLILIPSKRTDLWENIENAWQLKKPRKFLTRTEP